ncbi:MAG: hypothetical protein AB2813_01170, partial [Candidatus Sedimenticola endophacoides]
LHEQQLSGDYLQADETRIQVLKEDGKVATSVAVRYLFDFKVCLVFDLVEYQCLGHVRSPGGCWVGRGASPPRVPVGPK